MNWQKPNTNSHSYADNYVTCSDLHERSAQNEREQKNSTRAVGSKYLLVHAAAVAVLRCMPYRCHNTWGMSPFGDTRHYKTSSHVEF